MTKLQSEQPARNHRIRRTLSFINSNRRRAVQYCTLNKARRNRRLSLNQPKRIIQELKETNEIATSSSTSTSLTNITNQLKKYADELGEKTSSVKLSTFKRLKQKFHNNLIQDFKSQNFFNFDKALKEYIEQSSNREAYQVSL